MRRLHKENLISLQAFYSNVERFFMRTDKRITEYTN
nr:MAG TPA: hypothetical protein [Caudoviricetes sp.]